MKFTEFFSGQRIIQSVLDWLGLSKEEAIKERVTDVWEDGVVENELNNMAIVGKDVDPLLQLDHVKIDTGVAYINGERTLIGDATIPYDVSHTTDTTDDGKGTPILTPHSTGSFDIDLTTYLGSVVYFYIAYLLTTDELEFSLHKLTNVKQFYKRTDGYEIRINNTGINPDPARFIFLGTVDVTGGSGTAISSNISLVGRNVSRTKIRRIGIETANVSKTDRPASYSLGNNKLALDDHIKAVGTGAVSPTNPHGLTIADLGVAPNQTVEEHRKLEHSEGNAILAGDEVDPFPTTSAMYVLKIDTTIDYLMIRSLLSTEVVIINGIGYGSSSFSSNVNLYMTDDGTTTGTPLATGTYQIVFDASTQSILPPIAGTSKPTNVNYLWLATVSWDLSSTSIIGSPIDRRKIGGTVNKLQRWEAGGRPSPAQKGHFGYNVDINQLEYYNGSSWIPL